MMFTRGKQLGLLVAGLAALVVLGGCGYNIPPNMVAVHVTAGPFQSKKVVGCVNPSDRKFWTNDDYPLFPTSEREWDATGQKGADAKPFQSVTSDSVVMNVPITVRFTLKTDCATLKQFYIRYAQRYGAHFNSDGGYNEQWETLLRKLVADPADQTLDRIVQGYKWRDVWNSPDIRAQIEQKMNEALNSENSLLVQTAKASYFEGLSVLVGGSQPQNPELAAAVAKEQTLVAQADSERAQAKADQQKALAQVAVSKAEAEKQRAEIEGYRLKGMSAKDALRAYNQAKAIEAGQNPFQPQYIVGGTVPAP